MIETGTSGEHGASSGGAVPTKSPTVGSLGVPMTIVERVARAMAVADGCDPDDPAYVRYPGGHAFGVCWRDKYAKKARAAIEAMREPTGEMSTAGKHYMKGSADELFERTRAEGVWSVMISSALQETPEEG